MDHLLAIWTVTVGVVLVILGFNALVIVHEFGHFIVARLCGVRCEKFYIWFDFWGLKFFKFKWGETEFGLGLFPLGGYVKMLGQEDDPGAIRREIERAKIDSSKTADELDGRRQTADGSREPGTVSPEELPKDSDSTLASAAVCRLPSADSPIFAPDSYLSKSVPQRLAIIVAGVIMNFLFAILCAAGAYMLGMEESTSAIGNVFPGSPAWTAGLQPGDRITGIDGKPAKVFSDVNMKMIDGSETVTLDIDRQGEPLSITVKPRKRDGDLTPNIGVGSMPILELGIGTVNPLWEKYFSPETLAALKKHTETNPLRLEKVEGQEVKNYVEYQEAQLKKIGQPITCTFGGTDVEIPAIPMRTIPVQFVMGTIVSVLPGSDAAKQGIVPGDRIVTVDGKEHIDPLKLPQMLLQKVNAGQKSVELGIEKENGDLEVLTPELLPIRILPELSAMSMRDPLGSTALGLAWTAEPVIYTIDTAATEQDSREPETVSPSNVSPDNEPTSGDTVVGVEFLNCERLLNRNSFSETTNTGGFFIHDIGTKIDIPYIMLFLLQEAQAPKAKKGEEQKTVSVRLTLRSGDGDMKVVDMPIQEAADWYQTDRGYYFMPELAVSKAQGIGEALKRGAVKTLDYSLLVYKSVNALVNGTVSTKALNGPVGIVNIMYQISQGDWSRYLMLLCLIGANLAVINIFPIPPLDGGHVLFLLYEGIFRRAPNELIQVVLSYLGLFLIILLMVWTLTLDLACIPRW